MADAAAEAEAGAEAAAGACRAGAGQGRDETEVGIECPGVLGAWFLEYSPSVAHPIPLPWLDPGASCMPCLHAWLWPLRLQVGAKRFPVTTIYLDQVHELPDADASTLPGLWQVANHCNNAKVGSDTFLSSTSQSLLEELLRRIAKPGNCYVVFLPGLGEIEGVYQRISAKPPDCPSTILPLHSLLPNKEQDKVHPPSPPPLTAPRVACAAPRNMH